MAKRQRPPFDPFAGQTRSTRRPGTFHEQGDPRPDPNIEFIGIQASAAGGAPIDWFGNIFRSIGRRKRKGNESTGTDPQG